MTERGPQADARREAAADWVVRLQAPDLDEAEVLAFDAWLQQAPENGSAFDAALSVWRAYGQEAQAVAQGLAERRAARPHRRRVMGSVGVVAAAAAVTAAVVLLPDFRSGGGGEAYATGTGERRTVTLADGSTIHLNAGTRLSVSLARGARQVVLEEGQAVFDVAPDALRPFTIAAGDRTVRVVGTEFDVRRRDGQLAVTVASGTVEVRPNEGAPGRAYRLHPGQRLVHREGAAETRVALAEPAEVLGWRAGRLVYREQPLGEVIADLNRQFETPIRIADARLAATPISGVLVLDDQDAVIRRLALLVPISAVRSPEGVVLRRAGPPQR